jgi:hypothetical protein
VNVNVTQFSFSASGAVITPGPTSPGTLSGSATTCPGGSFTNSRVVSGGCTETYQLQGAFTGPDSWTGTFSMSFSGSDCSCFGFDPCVNQSFPVTATR